MRTFNLAQIAVQASAMFQMHAYLSCFYIGIQIFIFCVLRFRVVLSVYFLCECARRKLRCAGFVRCRLFCVSL